MKTAGVFALVLASAAAFSSPLLATRAVGGTIDKKTVKSTFGRVAAPVKKAANEVKKAAPVKQAATAVKKAAPVKKAVAVAKKAAPAKNPFTAVKKAAPAKNPFTAVKKAAPAKNPLTAVKKAAPVKQAVSAVKKAVPAAKKAVPVPAKKAVSNAVSSFKSATASAPSAPPGSKGYPTFTASTKKFRLGNISGGGNKSIQPVFIHPTVNTAAVPKFDYKKLGEQRLIKKRGEFIYDDGLTELERRQRATIPAFLTGGAKTFKNVDKSAITKDIVISDYPLGLSADDFQLLFITIFGLFTLVGCLSGNIKLD